MKDAIKNAGPAPEFSRVVHADSVRRGAVVEVIEANEHERRALAERFELESIGRLVATIRLAPSTDATMVRVSGTLEAEVAQTCVVTLEPVPARVRERFEALFAPDALIPDSLEEIDIDPNISDEDVPEPMPGGRIDIGELTAQHLSLALDPYPRAPGATFIPITPEAGDVSGDGAGNGGAGELEEPDEPGEGRKNPFAALLKRR